MVLIVAAVLSTRTIFVESVGFVSRGECQGFHIGDVVFHSIVDSFGKVGIQAQEFRPETRVHAEHILQYKHLSVGA